MAREMEFKSLFFCALNCLEVMECRDGKEFSYCIMESEFYSKRVQKSFISKMVDLRVVFWYYADSQHVIIMSLPRR